MSSSVNLCNLHEQEIYIVSRLLKHQCKDQIGICIFSYHSISIVPKGLWFRASYTHNQMHRQIISLVYHLSMQYHDVHLLLVSLNLNGFVLCCQPVNVIFTHHCFINLSPTSPSAIIIVLLHLPPPASHSCHHH